MNEYTSGGFYDFLADVLKGAAQSGIKSLTDDKDKVKEPAGANPLSQATMKVSPPPDHGGKVPMWVWLALGYILLKGK